MEMTEEELKLIIGMIAKGQGRQVDESDLDFWDGMIGDLDGKLVIEAVKYLIRIDGSFITPDKVIREYKRIAAERLQAVSEPPVPPAHLSQQEYLQWHRTWRSAIVHGAPETQAEAVALQAIGRTAKPELVSASFSLPGMKQLPDRSNVEGVFEGEIIS